MTGFPDELLGGNSKGLGNLNDGKQPGRYFARFDLSQMGVANAYMTRKGSLFEALRQAAGCNGLAERNGCRRKLIC